MNWLTVPQSELILRSNVAYRSAFITAERLLFILITEKWQIISVDIYIPIWDISTPPPSLPFTHKKKKKGPLGRGWMVSKSGNWYLLLKFEASTPLLWITTTLTIYFYIFFYNHGSENGQEVYFLPGGSRSIVVHFILSVPSSKEFWPSLKEVDSLVYFWLWPPNKVFSETLGLQLRRVWLEASTVVS